MKNYPLGMGSMFENSEYLKKSITLNFFTQFILTVVILQLVVYVLQANFSAIIQGSITHAVGLLYSMVDSSIVIDGNLLIHQDSLGFLIVDNSCTGLMLLASVCSAIIAFEHTWHVKVKMILIAIFILQCENIVRIAHLLYVVKNQNSAFDMFHLYIWQAINFATALVVILGLDKKFKGNRCI
ncbi:archaeosortase/exosortase family protein [Colwellia sp. MSW7]|jgi:exosortase/archaeosortase family protein|uniref:Archaeosortase/exosortase family protein n=1 Tax=Colwellia maritima TaxID=2912588 RepID=A0ABS9WXJ9_9GAMM|nr:archaeosortase/exosortase family protein [Colwellia maritima]MCI2282723.1 archaeosortase/exosortase family protein [Colwellia maritima]